MKHAPSTLTAMLLLAVSFWAISANVANACSECLCFSDVTCSNSPCDLTANCNRFEFTPRCDGDYLLRTETQCTTDSLGCSLCQSCANLYWIDGTTEEYLANCHTANCNSQPPECARDCQSVELSSSKTYVIYVCKRYCPGVASSCEECKNSCTAYACLSYGLSNDPCRP